RTRVSETAGAELVDKDGKALGKLTLTQEMRGVHIAGKLTGLPMGPHGMHIHATGQCHGPDFISAGAHFNPYNRKHGWQNKDGPHAGDLPNINVDTDGSATIDVLATLVTLRTGKNSLFGNGGTCLVLHERPDDEVTDPAGSTGSRIACG